jgi:nucleoid DNA-binding protein
MAIKKAKTTSKTAAAKKAKVKTAMPTKKIVAIPDRQTKIEILQTLADKTHLTKKNIALVFDELLNLIEGHLKKKGSGTFTIPGTGIKINRRFKQKTKARQMVSPLTGQEVTIAAKPARTVVKITALKQLKELVDK